MNSQTYQHFRDLIHRKGGIALGPDKKALLAGRIKRRVTELNLKSDEEYFSAVRHDETGAELVRLLDAIATNHTYFFREEHHLEVVKSHILKKSLLGQRRFRIWCAASSSGEEPYSLLMTLMELFDQHAIAPDFKLLATDISTKVLRQAERGWYPAERVAAIPAPLLEKYFRRESHLGQPGFRVGDRLRQAVMFRRLNLIEFPYPMKGPLDALLCRNVMIYFDEATRRSIVRESARLLPEGGLFIVGMTESILGMHAGFDSVSASAYRRNASPIT